MTRRILVATFLLLLVAGISLLALSGEEKREAALELKLANGRRIQLAAVTYGDPHTMEVPRIRQIARALFPNALRKSFGPTANSSFGFGEGSGMALWLMCYDPSTDSYVSGAIGHLAVRDEHGCEFRSAGRGATGDGYYLIDVIHLPVFPRRQREIVCEIFDPAGASLGTMSIPIKPVESAEAWVPEPLPSTKTNGPYVVRLEGFHAGATANCTVWHEGKQLTHWTSGSSEFVDSTGNRGYYLCPKEPAWKWTATILRRPEAEFASQEIVAFPTMPAPVAGVMKRIDQTIATPAGNITLGYIAGPGQYTLSNGVCVASRPWAAGMGHEISSSSGYVGGSRQETLRRATDKSFLMIRESLLAGKRVMARARKDEEGKPGEIVATAVHSAGGAMNWTFFDLDLKDVAEPITTELIVQEGKTFEFPISPAAVPKVEK